MHNIWPAMSFLLTLATVILSKLHNQFRPTETRYKTDVSQVVMKIHRVIKIANNFSNGQMRKVKKGKNTLLSWDPLTERRKNIGLLNAAKEKITLSFNCKVGRSVV